MVGQDSHESLVNKSQNSRDALYNEGIWVVHKLWPVGCRFCGTGDVCLDCLEFGELGLEQRGYSKKSKLF